MHLLYLRNIWYVYGPHSYRFSQDIPDFMGLNNKVAVVPIRTKVFRVVPLGISQLRDTELEG